MTLFRADLHCHSTLSDGTDPPKQLVQKALEAGLKGLSITDHDTVAAYPDILDYASNLGLQMLTGVEFSTTFQGVSIHVLAYAFSPQAEGIRQLCTKHKKRRKERLVKIAEKLQKLGMPIEITHLMKEENAGTIGRPHVAEEMIKEGYVDNPNHAFKEYLIKGRPAYVPAEAVSVEETIRVIHEAKGLAVIAHPHLIKDTGLVKGLLSLDFDGLEGHYCRFRKQDNARWIKIAMHRNWLITGGSDFHGDNKRNILLGSSWTPEEVFNTLHNHFLKNI